MQESEEGWDPRYGNRWNYYNSSMYMAAKRFNQQLRLISTYDGKVWRNRYAIKVLTESN